MSAASPDADSDESKYEKFKFKLSLPAARLLCRNLPEPLLAWPRSSWPAAALVRMPAKCKSCWTVNASFHY